ncbi:MAG: uncharacterized protein JWO60_1910 [Frankiales bacterium]|nr:uncharacterized protein [Frankiales bacterium]
MITLDQARTLKGKTLMGNGGQKLGTIDTLYADRDGGEPTFATVQTGRFGAKTHFVPLASATLSGDTVTVPYASDLVDAAPNIDPDSDLSPQEEQRLYSHYGVTGGYTATSAGEGQNVHGTVGHDTSGPTTDDAMTRSEERLHVGTETTEAGRARLRKYITSETETRTVPVSHEEVRIEREPITEGNVGQALDGPNLSEEEHEVVLTEERPVVAKETVPVERVRLDTETVTENVQVTEEVRKEQIEADGVYPDAGRTTGQQTGGQVTETESEFTVEPRK